VSRLQFEHRPSNHSATETLIDKRVHHDGHSLSNTECSHPRVMQLKAGSPTTNTDVCMPSKPPLVHFCVQNTTPSIPLYGYLSSMGCPPSRNMCHLIISFSLQCKASNGLLNTDVVDPIIPDISTFTKQVAIQCVGRTDKNPTQFVVYGTFPEWNSCQLIIETIGFLLQTLPRTTS